MRTKSNISIIVSILLVCTGVVSSNASAGLIWSQGFETLNNGNVDGQGMTWYASDYSEVATTRRFARVVDNASIAYDGSKCLEVHRGSTGYGLNCGWYDDTTSAPHGGMFQITFWMNRDSEADWQMQGYAWNTETVFSLGNQQVGSASTIDVFTSGSWQETLAIIPADTWRQISIEMDFDQSTVQYRVKAGSGDWQGWYDSGIAANYFRYFSFSLAQDTTFYLDNFELIPEPTTLSLLAFGGLALLRKAK